jgi:hypothetical protein
VARLVLAKQGLRCGGLRPTAGSLTIEIEKSEAAFISRKLDFTADSLRVQWNVPTPPKSRGTEKPLTLSLSKVSGLGFIFLGGGGASFVTPAMSVSAVKFYFLLFNALDFSTCYVKIIKTCKLYRKVLTSQ